MASEKVLIIDDSRLYREVLKRTLIDAGYDVATAEDGQKGVEAAREENPDLIITDMDMPIMSGEDVCRSLKADSATRMVPIIMFTGTNDTDLVEQLDAGADDYLPKTQNFRELRAKVKAFLRIKRLQDQLLVQNEKLKHENEINEMELGMARELQLGLIPQVAEPKGRLDMAFRYIPTSWASGDLFDVVEGTDGCTNFFISDVSGHGVGAAFVTAMIKTSVQTCSHGTASVGDLVEGVNNAISALLSDGMFVTAFFGSLSADATRIQYVNAGHLPGLLIRSGAAAIEHLESSSFPLGVMDDVEYEAGEVSAAPGDRLVLYTDGIIEADDDSGEQYGMQRFEESVLACRDKSLDELVDRSLNELIKFSGKHTFEDDVNLLAVEVLDK